MPEKITQLQKELETIIKGKKAVTDKIIMAVLARGHILLEDVPGVGKTTTPPHTVRMICTRFSAENCLITSYADCLRFASYCTNGSSKINGSLLSGAEIILTRASRSARYI